MMAWLAFVTTATQLDYTLPRLAGRAMLVGAHLSKLRGMTRNHLNQQREGHHQRGQQQLTALGCTAGLMSPLIYYPMSDRPTSYALRGAETSGSRPHSGHESHKTGTPCNISNTNKLLHHPHTRGTTTGRVVTCQLSGVEGGGDENRVEGGEGGGSCEGGDGWKG